MEIILAFSIVDTIFGQKGTTDTTSCNGWNEKVRQQSKKTGKNMGKSTLQQKSNWKSQSDKSYIFLHYIHSKGATNASYSKNNMTYKTSCNGHKRPPKRAKMHEKQKITKNCSSFITGEDKC